MATAAVPKEIYPIAAAKLSAVMTLPLEAPYQTALLEKLKTQDVCLMGCGIGRGKEAEQAVFTLLETAEKPMVLDADALNIIALNPEVLKITKAPLVLTPHKMEFARLTGLPLEAIQENPLFYARKFATEYGVTLILKDAVTIVAEKTGKLFISTISNSGMATAGSGDVLAGIVTGLLAQGAECEAAAVCGVYLHLAAGRIAKEKQGEYGMTAEDILEAVPKSFFEM